MKELIRRASRMEGGIDLDIWTAINDAAANSVFQPVLNMGQGFFGYDPPKFVLEAMLRTVLKQHCHQYAHPRGNIRLLKAFTARYSALLNRKLDYQKEVVVTTGANEGLHCAITAFVEPGDEVILLEPCFDIYVDVVQLAGGVPRYVPLKVPSPGSRNASRTFQWSLDLKAVEEAINPRTKAIILNTPHNPTGKVFTEEELRGLAALCIKHSILVISDEVYDCLSFVPFTRIANLSQEIWERTLTVYSAGKTFYTTGWRVGFLVGPEHLIQPAARVHRGVCFCSPSPLQEAAAIAYEEAEAHGFYAYTKKSIKSKLDRFNQVWIDLGLPYTASEGTYYTIVDLSRLQIPADFEVPEYIVQRGHDHVLSWFLVQRFGVAGIPLSAFHCDEHKAAAATYLRFAVCKVDDDLDRAKERLLGLKDYLVDPEYKQLEN